jgi:hypothetical protein
MVKLVQLRHPLLEGTFRVGGYGGVVRTSGPA